MRQFSTACIIAIGVAALLGGACALTYGFACPGATRVIGLGPLDGVWSTADYWFLGGALAAFGGGLITFGLLMRTRPESARVGRAREADAFTYPGRDASAIERHAIQSGPER